VSLTLGVVIPHRKVVRQCDCSVVLKFITLDRCS